MKSILIISPHFPPVNAADMHRIRQSLWFFPQFGWKPTVIAVDPKHVETGQDELLLQTIPSDAEIHFVKAFSTKWTRKIGLGALALRSLWFYFLEGNQLLKSKKFDLIYFSTTQFPVLILGRYWKWRFKVPYIIDMQDPWHSEFYKYKPKNERPPKYWFSYNLNKFLEPIAMKGAAGIISVSEGYCKVLQERYSNIKENNCTVIPFGAFEKDFQIVESLELRVEKSELTNAGFGAEKEYQTSDISILNSQLINCLYIGRGGHDMRKSLSIIFGAFKKGLELDFELFSKVRLQFIGTSYAPGKSGEQTIFPLAGEMGISEYVYEDPARIPYFSALSLLRSAAMLIIPGSEDPNYTASKLYPYILAKKPMLAVFSSTSSVISVLDETKAGEYVTFDPSVETATFKIEEFQLASKWILILKSLPFVPKTNWAAFEPFTAKEMTRKQVDFFEKIMKVSK